MAELEIRSFQPADGNLEGFFITALHTVYPDIEPGAWTADLTNIPPYYMGEGGDFLVAAVDDRIVAIGGIHRARLDNPSIAEMKRVAVDPKQKGHRYGRTLVQALERRSLELGFAQIDLDTTEAQKDARHLYEALGYKLVDRHPVDHPSGRTFDTFFYRKSLLTI